MRWRLLVAEALVLLVLSRLLVSAARLGLWRRWLGPLAPGPLSAPAGERERLLAKAVERATVRLPGGARCLPRAMALHRMLHRRGLPAQVVIAVLHGQARGGLDDLHAWVETGGEILIGRLDGPFHPVARFGTAP